MNKKYHEKYDRKNGNLQIATWCIRNKLWETLICYNKKHLSWQIPSGKVEKWENAYDALVRELHEELNITITHHEFLWNSKKIFYNMCRESHLYIIHTTSQLQNNEPDTMWVMKWVSLIPNSNRLWYSIKYENTLINDPCEILTYWHMTTEIRWLTTNPAYQYLMHNTVILPKNIVSHENYIQYRNKNTELLHVLPFKEFTHML